MTYLSGIVNIQKEDDPGTNPGTPGGTNIYHRYVECKVKTGGPTVLVPILARLNKTSGAEMQVLDWSKYPDTSTGCKLSVEFELVKMTRNAIPSGFKDGTNTQEDGEFYGAVISKVFDECPE